MTCFDNNFCEADKLNITSGALEFKVGYKSAYFFSVKKPRHFIFISIRPP